MAATGASSPSNPGSYLGEPLEQPPADGITRLRFSALSDTLLVSSWDKTVRLYDVQQRRLRATLLGTAPMLDSCFQDESNVFTAGLDGAVRRRNIQSQDDMLVGSHSAAARCLEYLPSRGLLVSGGWDQSLRIWDPRSPAAQACVRSIALPGRVYSMSAAADRLVVGTSGRHVLVYDVRRIEGGQAEQQRESSLKYQTRCVAAFPDGRGFAIGSVEGRVAIEFFDPGPEAQSLKYAFKCHRRQEDSTDVVYPVHSMAFHPTYGTFATGGGDGVISIWDGTNKKRLFQVSRYPTSVSALAFNRDGSLMAVASSYAYEHGECAAPADEIYIRPMQDAEVRPKSRPPK